MKTKSLLIAARDEALRGALYRHLSPHFACVVLAADGTEAARKSRQIRFDIALVHLDRPDRQGLQTIADLREENPLTSVVVLSRRRRGDPGQALDVARLMGADAAQAEPCTPGELLDVLAWALVRRRAAA